ncbi:ribosome maturation factor RimM [Methylocapsa acidiphila]|uniref:ribosome maturation factor RimM n=1 Tax=Methylocapsa acidiphila TaxID=133552 RepID=UPI00041C8416|nr:ribosome maturation factor RimM [Methylocapsa acidiphila]
MVKDRILVGRFGAPHGVRGELRLKSFTSDPAAIATYAPLLDASGVRRFVIKAMRLVKDDLFVARVAGVEDRDSASALTNVEIFVPREALPAAEDEEFYLADLVGLAAVDAEGGAIGRVVDVLNFGAGDLLEIAPAAGGETVLLPFTKEVVPEIDVSAGRLTIVPPVEIDGEGADK